MTDTDKTLEELKAEMDEARAASDDAWNAVDEARAASDAAWNAGRAADAVLDDACDAYLKAEAAHFKSPEDSND